MSDTNHTFVVILAGGGGTRLWPKSRDKSPKQFLRLYTNNTLMQDAYERNAPLADPSHVLVVTNKEYLKDAQKQLPDVPKENFIAEPQKKETAAAMLLGSLVAYHRDPEAVIINQASDHVVSDHKEFLHVMEAAAKVAASGKDLVTVGILPLYPHSGLGYIKINSEIEKVDKLPVFHVASFTEKPNVATAKAFISTGKYFWNANMYVWKASTLIEAFEKHQPQTLNVLKPLLQSIGTPAFEKDLQDAYEKVEKISIDYAISEKADNLVLIPGDFGWNDIGDWSVVYDLHEKNESGDVIIAESEGGTVISHDSRNNLVHTFDRMIALVGMEDTIVVDTGEILLVMPRSRSQDVKKIVERIKEKEPKYL